MDHLNGHPTDLTYYFLTPTILGNAAFAPLVPSLPLAGGGTYVQNEHSYALFGSLGWNVTEQLKVSAGLRGSWVYKTNQANNFYGQGTEAWGGVVALPANLQPLAAKILGATTAANGSLSNSDYIPSAKLQYKITPDVMAYFSYSNGFKAGVPTGGVVNGVAVPEILPENVDAYEVGIKSEWLDHRVLLNLDAFRSNYNNLQVTSAIFTPLGVPIIVTTNAANSRSQGLEFEGQWAVAENFRLSSALTYLDSHYVSYPNVTLTGIQTYCRAHPALAACAAQFPSGVPVLQDLSGERHLFLQLLLCEQRHGRRPAEAGRLWAAGLAAHLGIARPALGGRSHRQKFNRSHHRRRRHRRHQPTHLARQHAAAQRAAS